mgnify:CR=1 FL=1
MKVICDVCGTTFAETEANCPICGCAAVRPAKTVTDDGSVDPKQNSTANAYARGGRFSKTNVKRNSRTHRAEGRFSGDKRRRNEEQQGNKGLIAVVVILLLAIIMVVVYIGVNVLFKDVDTNSDGIQTTGSQQQNVGGDNQGIPCTSVQIGSPTVVLEQENESVALAIKLEPQNTTDKVTYTSSDPDVATVDDKGNIQPGTKQGTVTITVTCGTAFDTCTVISSVGEEPVTSEPITPDVTLPDGFVLKLKTYKDSGEITIAGDAVTSIYSEIMGVKASDINWTTSDPSIATVENGKVTGVGKGYCYITAAIGDQTATCKVICSSDGTPPSDYKISHVDVTIAVGETFNLSLKNKETGANVQGIEWQASEEGVVSINGNKITGVSVAWSGVNVYVEYEGIKYSCRIIVKPAE